KGEGPDDLTELCLTLGSHMAVLAGKVENIEQARDNLQENLQSGKALAYFKQLLESQGGNSMVIDDSDLLPQATYVFDLPAPLDGTIEQMNANRIGTAAMMLGAGRQTTESVIDLAVGIVLHKKIGDQVQKGESLLTIYANEPSIQPVKDKLLSSIHVTTDPHKDIKRPDLIYETIK